MNEHISTIRRRDIFFADLSPVIGSEQGGIRPVLIIQNNVGNRYSPTVIVASITSRTEKVAIPTHVAIGRQEKLEKESFVLLEQIRTIDKIRLRDKAGVLSEEKMKLVDKALLVSVGLEPAFL